MGAGPLSGTQVDEFVERGRTLLRHAFAPEVARAVRRDLGSRIGIDLERGEEWTEPVARDASSGHRRYSEGDLDDLQVLACLRAMGVGIGDMRTYQANRRLGHGAAAEQRDILERHANRVEAEIATLRIHLEYLREKSRLWDARARRDARAEEEARARVLAATLCLREAI